MFTKENCERLIRNVVFLTKGQAYNEQAASIVKDLELAGLKSVFVDPGADLEDTAGSVKTGGGIAELSEGGPYKFRFSVVELKAFFIWIAQ